MLGTTIIAASLATGDTMSHTIRAHCGRGARADRRGGRRATAPSTIPGCSSVPQPGTGWLRRVASPTMSAAALAGIRPRRRRRRPRSSRRRRRRPRPARQRAARDALRAPTRRDGRVRRDPRGSRGARSPSPSSRRARSTSTTRRPTSSASAAATASWCSSPAAVTPMRRRATSSSTTAPAPPSRRCSLPLAAGQALFGAPGEIDARAGLEPRRRDSARARHPTRWSRVLEPPSSRSASR